MSQIKLVLIDRPNEIIPEGAGRTNRTVTGVVYKVIQLRINILIAL